MKRKRNETDGSLYTFQRQNVLYKTSRSRKRLKITESVEKQNGTTWARYGKEKIITLQRKALEK